MKTKTANYTGIEVTLSKEDIEKTDLSEEKINKVFDNYLIHMIRVPVEMYREYQTSDIKKLLYPHLQTKCKVVYYTELLDQNGKTTLQCFTPTYH